MALSFNKTTASSVANEALTTSAGVVTTENTSNDTRTLCTDGRYEIYTQYQDDNLSIIDDSKNISVNERQIVITGEQNSQYIPFRMKRYWDGVDFMNMLIQIPYENASKDGSIATPINVSYNDEYIYFGWLLDNVVTSQAGNVTFEIHALGVNEKGGTFKWRTKPNGKFTVLEALSYDGIIEPTYEWYTGFVNTIMTYVAEAKEYADEAKSVADSLDLTSLKQNIKDDVTTTLNNYYTIGEIDTIVEELNTSIGNLDSLSNLQVSYDNATGKLIFKDSSKDSLLGEVPIDTLSNFDAKYEVLGGVGKIAFYNGETELVSIDIGNTNPSQEWTNSFYETIKEELDSSVTTVNEKISLTQKDVSSAQTDIGNLQTSIEKIEVSMTDIEKDTSIARQDAADAKGVATSLNASVESNSLALSDLNSGVAILEEKIGQLTTPSQNEYRIGLLDEQTVALYENDEINSVVVITGGGGGGTTSSTIKIDRITPASAVYLSDDTATIKFNFSSIDSSGDETGTASASWRVGSTNVATTTVTQGENSINLSQYLKVGDNTVRVTITDSFGTVGTKNWTITIIDLTLSSTFDESLFYSGDITFRYTPYGNVEKNIVFTLDGEKIGEVVTSVTGRQMTYPIPAQSHGSHLLEVYITAEINGQTVKSDSIYKDIIWVETGNSTPIIGCSIYKLEAVQYNTTPISYVVYDPENNPASITLWENEDAITTVTVGRTSQTWSYRSNTAGNKILKITCGNTVKLISAVITELGIDISPVVTNLSIDYNPSGRHNGEVDWLKIDDSHSILISDNFDKVNGGYQVDNDGDTYFCVKSGTTAQIPFELFADDAKRTGKNFKFIYKCTNVKNYDAQVLSCMSNGVGFKVFAQKAVLSSEQNEIDVAFCEDNYMELEFNILPDSEYMEMVMWLDGIPSRAKLYSASDSFTQTAPVGITIGSDDCDVWIYRMKSYSMNLTDDEILDNFIADAKNADEMISRYMCNNILDSSGNLEPDLLAEKCPNLRIIKIDAPRFTTGKKDKVSSHSFQQIFKNGRARDNWLSLNGKHSGQGTSSEYYGEAGRNMDLDCSGGFTFSDGTFSEKYDMTDASVPVNYFNIKVNIASCENINNSYLANESNRFNPYLRPARIYNSKVRDTMEFHPCVVFIRETDIENSVEFHDGQWHFYACGNIGNSKKNAEAMGMNPENHKEFIVEVSNNTDPQCRFLSDDLTNEGWDGDSSFEMRYENPNCTDEELQAGKDAWQALLTWVVNATPEAFVNEFEDHFIKDSLLFYYLFTERHTLVDNRAKNTFWHTEDLIHWDVCFNYDNDTAMGNDNVGGLTLSYGYEDIDMIGTKSVFNAADSKLWCYMRDYMYNDIAAMFIRLESELAWSSNRILSEMEAEQALFPERLKIMDMRRKYFRPYEDNGTTSYLEMMHGDKKHQRRQFQKYQEKYISSKYVGAVCTSDVITIRGYTPENWSGVEPDGTLSIVPYANTYVVARFGSNQVKTRAERGQLYEMVCPVAALNDTEIYVYNASMIQSIGDISPLYPGYTDFNQGIKLTDLTIGSGKIGYVNTNMIDFGIGKNTLLEHLDLQNLPNLQKTIDLSACTNLVDFLAEGSGITGVILPTQGKIQTVHLPSLSSVSAKELHYLTDFTLEGYENVTTLLLENCSSIDELDFLNKATSLSRVRLTGIDWNVEDTGILDRLSSLSGIDENGYNTITSYISGSVHVPVMKEKKLEDYRTLWPDIDITYDTLVSQYTVTFINKDGTILDVQYVDKGDTPVNPILRKENPIAVPTMESSQSTVYTYKEWDTVFVPVFANMTITATYSETPREYTVKYVSKGTVLQETKAPYGTMVFYNGESIPTYTSEESAYKFNLFSRWDKSGYITGDMTINAVYDTCEYNQGYFDEKDLSTLTPVEIYTMISLGLEDSHVDTKDSIKFIMGNDYTFEDIDENIFISEEILFTGNNYVDTGISLLDVDRDWVIAIDYKFDSDNVSNAVLAQCYQSDGSQGFRLWNSSQPRLTWGTSSSYVATSNKRDIIVLRHLKGESILHVYSGNLPQSEISYSSLLSNRDTTARSTLVFGCSRADDGAYENYAKGTIYWCKAWFADLGDEACRNLAAWTHESISLEMYGFKKYYLGDDSGRRCNMSFLASHLLDNTMQLNSTTSNTGGWASCTMNSFLNERFYNAIPIQWRQLIKQVKISSTIGSQSSEISASSCFVAIPSISEIDASMNFEPYNYEGSPIPFITSNSTRLRRFANGIEGSYWLRSPNISYASYFTSVDASGNISQYEYGLYEKGCLVILSI